VNPTFGIGPRTVESYILDFDQDIYGQSIKVSFIKKLRDEVKFDNVAGLVAQIQDDVKRTHEVFRMLGIAADGG
jgi:riboflavin kinase / FMN adenylyltransferase